MKAQAPIMNNAPELENAILIQEVYYGKYFEFTLPANTFVETDENDRIVRYEASMFNGTGLPEWIYFNGEELKFWGRPEKKHAGEYFISLKAYDTHNAFGITELFLIVK